MKVTVIPIVVGSLGTIPEGLKKKTGETGNQRMTRDHLEYNLEYFEDS